MFLSTYVSAHTFPASGMTIRSVILHIKTEGRVSMTTGYGLDCPVLNPWWRQKRSRLHTHPEERWEPPSLLYYGYWGSLPGEGRGKVVGAWC